MFCVIEGLDGSGKSTQCELLKEKLLKAGLEVSFLHFPRYNDSVFGKIIASFLKGDLGNLNDNSPYLIALLFSVDQWRSQDLLKNDNPNSLILLDRYFYSNLAYQGAKIKNYEDRLLFRKWLLEANKEFSFLIPDVAIYLDVPKEFREKNILSNRQGQSREYLDGKQDIHEIDFSFQESVHNEYLDLCKTVDEFEKFDCTNNGVIDDIETINNKIINLLKSKGLKC